MLNYHDEAMTHHSIHLHGHGFAVMSMGYALQNVDDGQSLNNPDIVCGSSSCSTASWNKSRDVYVMQS